MNDALTIAGATILAAGISGAPAMAAAIASRRTRRSIQPNGELYRLLQANHSLLSATNSLLVTSQRLERYTHRRNHTIINGQFKIMLALTILLRKSGVEIPDPARPTSDTGDDPDLERLLAEWDDEALLETDPP